MDWSGLAEGGTADPGLEAQDYGERKGIILITGPSSMNFAVSTGGEDVQDKMSYNELAAQSDVLLTAHSNLRGVC
jgi:hypothetical protein